MARPTKYTAEMQERADWYANGGWAEVGDVVPSRAGLGVELGLARSTVALWGKEHAKFSDTLENIQQTQERIALSKGLTSDFNSTIAKLVLANHGYSDRQALDHTSADGSMTPKDSAAAVLEALRRKHEQ